MKTSVRTGEAIFNEIKTLDAQVKEITQAMHEVDDNMGRNTIPWKILQEAVTEKQKELNVLLTTKYTVYNAGLHG